MEKKILNIIRFNGDYEILNTKLAESVGENWVFIPSFDAQGNILKFKNQLSENFKNTLKVFHFCDSKPIDEKDFEKIFYRSIEKKIRENIFDFEKTIIVSQDYEFIDWENWKEVTEKLSENFVIFRQKNFKYSLDFYCDNIAGPICFTLSQFLIQKNFFDNVEQVKKRNSNFTDFFLENGWCFSFCYFNYNELPIGINHDSDVTQRFIKLKKFSQSIEPRKFLFFIDKKVPKKVNENEIIVKVNFDRSILKESFLQTSKNQIEFFLQLPESEIYNSENFTRDFMLSKIQKLFDRMKINELDNFIIN